MRRTTVTFVSLLVLVVSAGVAYAIFTKQATVGSNSFSTAADWVAPTTSASVIAKTAGGTVGYIHQGSTYYVYASVTDTGNPASGVSTVTANVSSITTGQTAASLTAGSYTIGGVTYSYRSASLTANAALSAGSYTYSITATDAAGNAATTNTWSVTVDNTAPAASDVQTTNKAGGTNGKAEQGDTLILTYTETMDPNSILAGWTGASTNVVVRLNDGGVIGNDTVTIYNSANTSQLPLGTVDMGSTTYTSANVTFGASGTASTMVMSGATITIALGHVTGTDGTALLAGTMQWTPSASATDPAGNACSTAAKSESGASDKDF